MVRRGSSACSMIAAAMLACIAMRVAAARAATLDEENAYYKLVTVMAPEAVRDSRDTGWKPPPDGLMLEVSGITELADGRLAVVTRKGEIWLITGAGDDPPTNVRYHRFASGLHEPLGLEWRDGAFWTAQRSELTRIADTDGDEVADDYATAAKGWGVTGHYHEYAYGPKPDGEGTFWLTLNTGLNLKQEHLGGTVLDAALGYRQGAWRGWALEVPGGAAGELEPVCCGLRSPSGLGRNATGAMFATDQQGNWVATNSLVHLRRGGFFGHPESLASRSLPGSSLAGVGPVVEGLPWPEAVRRMPFLTPPAVWFPYRKAGQSATDVMLDESGGRFGPFAGQVFVGEFTQAAVHRVFLEEVDGTWQGACFPFRSGFASAVLRLAQARDGSVYAGLTNRGWSSLGGAAYGLERLVWTGRTPFEIREMRARPDGFELVFTLPVDPQTAGDTRSYALASHTYLYHSAYGSDEIDRRDLVVRSATVSPDGLSVRLVVDGLRELHVHELEAVGVRDREGRPLLHAWAAYTLVKQPRAETAAATRPVDARPPNVVIIMADDLGCGDLGCFGGTTIRTPHIDRMAVEGTRFTSFYVGQSVCTASRAALLTGCYPNRVGMAGALNHTSPTGIAPAERLLSERLAQRGYATACYGKWHLGIHPPFWPTRRGFDEFFGIPYSNDNGPLHPTVRTMPPLPLHDGVDVIETDPDQGRFTRRFTERAIDFIARNRERPFFLYLPHVMPHVPIFASAEWRGSSGRGLYADVVGELDASVGEVLAALKTHGIDDRTLVVFLSDNGPFLSYGDHAGSAGPFREGKLTTFEGGMRVPCIARWPGKVPAGRMVDDVVSAMDLCATVAALAGVEPVDRRTDGNDLRPLLLGEAGAAGRDTFLFYSGTELQAVRQGDWKLHLPHDYLTVAAEPGRDGKPSNFGKMKPESMAESGVRGIASRHGYRVESLPLSLFDLAVDPGELRNVAAAHPEVVARLEAIAEEARNDLGDSLTGRTGAGVRPVGDIRVPDTIVQ